MAKKDKLLEAFKNDIGKWVCGYCNSGSNQPAAIFRELKKLGYSFAEESPNRWGKSLFCSNCKTERTHYKLLALDPEYSEKPRIHIDKVTRERILNLLDRKDAFTGASITSTPEIDHKVPWTRLDNDIDATKLTDNDILNHFQLLTREHNLLKDRACGMCKKSNLRTPFLGISFWYLGNSHYDGYCGGCGWYDGAKWRHHINTLLNEGS
jgi:hypothetical protein